MVEVKWTSHQLVFGISQLIFWFFHSIVILALASTFVKGWDLIIRFLVVTAINAAVFYAFFSWLIPKYAEKNQFRVFSIGAISILLFSIAVRYWSEMHLRPDLPENLINRPLLFQAMLIGLPMLFSSGTASIIRLLLTKMASEQKLNELELLQAQTELKFLKAQINPHFLFNTINNIYSLALEQSPNTPNVILQLSTLLRYMLYESNNAKVPLNREINIVKTFINLYQIKYEDPLTIELTLPSEADMERVHVVPLLFLNLLENAFKHSGIGDLDEAWIQLSFSIQEKMLYFQLKNSKFEVNTTAKPFSGIGVQNLQRQLELHYGENYNLQISNNAEFYQLDLQISI